MTPSRSTGRCQRRSLVSRRLAVAIVSTIFFAVAPVVVAGVIPWSLTHWRAGEPFPGKIAIQGLGALTVAVGVIVLVNAFVRFVTEGLGAPAPIVPTEQLVVGGLYRYVRNPMYIAVIAIIVGQALVLERPVLLVYATTTSFTMALFVRAYEEPALARQFGDQYERYRREVPRWCPRMHAWDPRSEAGE